MLEFDNTFIAFLGLVLGFSFLIFVHELGHFAVAKMVGIKCTQFAIGFGNAICSYRKGIGLRIGSTEPEYRRRVLEHLAKAPGFTPPTADQTLDSKLETQAAEEIGLGETEYRLNTLPLGGYVKMLGQEDLDPTHRSNDPRSFNTKSIAARFWVLSAGVIMNLIFGAILLAWAFMIGVNFPAPVVGGVIPKSPAATTYAQGHADEPGYLGILPGDTIVSVEGKPARDMMDLRIATALASRGKVITIGVHRQSTDERLMFDVIPEPGEDKLLSAGIMPSPSLEIEQRKKGGQRVPGILPGSNASQAGVEAGMRVVSVDGQPVTAYYQLADAVTGKRGMPVTLGFARSSEADAAITAPVRAYPLLTTQNDDAQPNLLGLIPAVTAYPTSQSPAAAIGVQPGDVIAQIGTVTFPSLWQLPEIVQKAGGSPLEIKVLREGKLITLDPIKSDQGKIGIAMLTFAPIISGTLPDSPAAAMERSGQAEPLPGGTRIVAVNGEPAATWADVQRLMQNAVAKPEQGADVSIDLSLQTILGDDEVEKLSLVVSETQRQALADAGWGMPPDIEFKQLLVTVKAADPLDAIGIGLTKTHQFMTQTYITLLRLFEGTVKPEHLRGPVGIIDEGTQIATRGFPYLLFFLGLISVNLAVINYLPIPIVDGGHILFLIIEKIKGSPVSVRVQTWASIAGLALIGLVFLTTLWYDVGRLGLLSLLGV